MLLCVCLLSGPTWAQAAEPYPNLPAGLNLLYQYDGNVLPLDQTTSIAGMTAGYGNRFGGGHVIVTDATATIDPSSVYQQVYPAGTAGGNSPGQMNFWNTPSPRIPVTHYYEAIWFKINGADFENPGTGPWKLLGFWAVGDPSGGGSNSLYQFVSCAHQVGSTAAGLVCDTWTTAFDHQNFAVRRIDAGTVQNNKWYRMEIEMVMNTPVTSANGVLKVWLTNVTDGGAATQIINVANFVYRDPTHPDGVWLRHYDPTWGGGSPAPKTRNDSVNIARIVGYGNSSGTTPPPTDTTAPSPPTNVQAR